MKVDTSKAFNIPLHEFEPFEFNEENFRKVLVTRDGNSEGPWACFSDEDVKRYDSDTGTGYAIAIMANESLNGIPWGAYFPVELHGRTRPTCDMNTMMNLKAHPIMNAEVLAQIEKTVAKHEQRKRRKGLH